MYREAARRAKGLGKDRIITYSLPEENGGTLEHAGLVALYETTGHKDGWHCESRPRDKGASPGGKKIAWERRLREGLDDLNKTAHAWRTAGRKPLYGEALRRQQSLFAKEEETTPGCYHIPSDCPHNVCYSTGELWCV